MTTQSRTRFQRLALFAFLALLVAVGVQQLGGVTFVRAGGDAPPTVPVSTSDVWLDETIPVGPGAPVALDLSSESVELVPGADGAVRVVITGETEAARRFFDDQRYVVRAEDGGVVLRADPRRRSERRRSGGAEDVVRVRVEVPAGARIAHDGGSGDLRVGKLAGRSLSVDVGSGNLALGELAFDEIALDTGSGDVEAQELRAAVLRIDTGSGDVSVERSVGVAEVDTGSGDVRFSGHDGAFEADTGSGDVEARLTGLRDSEVDTGSGNVSLALAGGARLEIDTSGRVTLDDALGFRGRADGGHVEGTVGGSGPRVVVDSGSGDVAVRGL